MEIFSTSARVLAGSNYLDLKEKKLVRVTEPLIDRFYISVLATIVYIHALNWQYYSLPIITHKGKEGFLDKTIL